MNLKVIEMMSCVVFVCGKGFGMEKKRCRENWLDIVKGIAMISIVFFHINRQCLIGNSQVLDDYFTNLFTSYEVLIFFCAAGFTLKEDKLVKFKDFVSGKFKTLYMKAMLILIPTVLLHNVFLKLGLYKEGMEYDGKIMHPYQLIDFVKQCILTLAGACREVMIGPMWFVNVLMFAFLVEAVLCWIINRIFRENKREIRLLICFLLMLVSSILTTVFDFTIPRGNNTLTAVFLIDLGSYIYKGMLLDNACVMVASVVMMGVLPFYGEIALNGNAFVSPSHLIATAIVSIYVLCWVSKKLERYWLGKLISVVGKYSFYIMAFQFFGFKVGSVILNIFTLESVHPLYDLIPRADNWFEVIFYFVFSIVFSVISGFVFEKVVKTIFKLK